MQVLSIQAVEEELFPMVTQRDRQAAERTIKEMNEGNGPQAGFFSGMPQMGRARDRSGRPGGMNQFDSGGDNTDEHTADGSTTETQGSPE